MNNEQKISLGKRIHNIRLSLGLSLNEFAKLVDPNGKAQSGTVANWEKGRNAPNKKRLARIAKLGNISVDELLNNNKLQLIEFIKESYIPLSLFGDITTYDLTNHFPIWDFPELDELIENGELENANRYNISYYINKYLKIFNKKLFTEMIAKYDELETSKEVLIDKFTIDNDKLDDLFLDYFAKNVIPTFIDELFKWFEERGFSNFDDPLKVLNSIILWLQSQIMKHENNKKITDVEKQYNKIDNKIFNLSADFDLEYQKYLDKVSESKSINSSCIENLNVQRKNINKEYEKLIDLLRKENNKLN